jgi:hypothetical protein
VSVDQNGFRKRKRLEATTAHVAAIGGYSKEFYAVLDITSRFTGLRQRSNP